jgi:hypothetical protein
MSRNPGVGIAYDDDDDLDSVTSPSSDSIRQVPILRICISGI